MNVRNAGLNGDSMKPTVISLFAGCGGSSLGYQLAGYKELLAAEWDDNACECLRLNFPGLPIYHGDVCKLTSTECMKLANIKCGELSVLDFSCPCQSFSNAGKRRFDDPRGGLFKEAARLLQELQPKAFVFENVTGLIQGVMKQAYLTIIQTLRDCGYRATGEVMNSMYYGVPQSRQRVIIIGVRNDLKINPSHPRPQTRPISVKQAWKQLEGITQTVPPLSKFLIDVVPRMKIGDCADDISGKGGFQTVRIHPHRPCPTITKLIAGTGFGALIHPYENRVLSIDEMKLATSFPLSFKLLGDYKEQKARIGNCVPPNLMKAIATHIKKTVLEVKP